MFSTDFIFRQQENLVDNQNVGLDSGRYATKYYYCQAMYWNPLKVIVLSRFCVYLFLYVSR